VAETRTNLSSHRSALLENIKNAITEPNPINANALAIRLTRMLQKGFNMKPQK